MLPQSVSIIYRVCPDPIQLFIMFAQQAAAMTLLMQIKLQQTKKQELVAVL